MALSSGSFKGLVLFFFLLHSFLKQYAPHRSTALMQWLQHCDVLLSSLEKSNQSPVFSFFN